jgi:hypothetical protein
VVLDRLVDHSSIIAKRKTKGRSCRMSENQTFTIGGKRVVLSKNAVEQAVRNAVPGPIKKYSVLIRGVRYPIKQAIALASGQPIAAFISTDAHRVLRRLGFEVDSES